MTLNSTAASNAKPALSAEWVEQFRAILGPGGFSDAADDVSPWLVDWRGIYHGQALGIASPENAAQVQQLVTLASKAGIALVPQGGNTSMVGGATPSEDGAALILSLRRMNKIRVIDPVANQAVVEAGVILSVLHEATETQGRRFPLSLGAKGSATIGGLVSTNAGGTQVLRFGTMRRLVLGMEAVLPDGTLYQSLRPLKKDNRGYDITQLLIGAEGTLGIVTAACLQLVSLPADQASAWVAVESPQQALRLLRWLEARTSTAIESFELMPEESVTRVCDHIAGARRPVEAPSPWHVLIEYVANDVGVSAKSSIESLLAAAMDDGFAQDAVIAASGAQSAAFWRLRESISEAERAAGPAMQHDISVPVDSMPDFIIHAAAEVERRFPRVKASAFGHLGDGNVHFHVLAPPGVDGENWRNGEGLAASAFVYDLVVAANGSISAEHGIGQMKRKTLARTIDPARLSAMRAIKHGLDPKNIMNPGKLLPLASDTIES